MSTKPNAERVWDPATYDASRRRTVPDFDMFYGTVATLVALTKAEAPRLLDLGAGTGLLTQAIAARVVAPTVTLLDRDSEMLDTASRRLQGVSLTRHVAHLEDPLPSGPFDAVVSALSIHHLEDAEKRDLYVRAFESLEPGGLFVNADQVAGPTEWHTQLYRQMHERIARAQGVDDVEWQAAVERMRIDRYATVEDQLQWLRDAGFQRTDCLFRRFGFAVFGGWKPA